jgi:hypothetical protein
MQMQMQMKINIKNYIIKSIIILINILHLHLIKANISTNENKNNTLITTENTTTLFKFINNNYNITEIIINTINTNQNNNINDYNFNNLNQTIKYNLLPLSIKSNYQSNNTCVTYQDQIKYNYSLDFYKYDYHGKIFPENFCYGLLTYNISRNDFNDIIRKNMSNYLFLISYLKFKIYIIFILYYLII